MGWILIKMADLTLQPSTKDNIPSKSLPTTNYGDVAYIRTAVWNTDLVTIRTFLTFNASAIPAGSTINSATLSLYYWEWNNGNPSGLTVWAYKLTRNDWVELESTWNIYKTANNWTTAGGDYVTSNPAGGSTTFPAAYAWMTWNIAAIVQDARDNVGGIVNLLLRFETESGDRDGLWYSRDEATQTTLRPKLVINYTSPPITRSISEVLALVDTTNKKAGFRRSLKERG